MKCLVSRHIKLENKQINKRVVADKTIARCTTCYSLRWPGLGCLACAKGFTVKQNWRSKLCWTSDMENFLKLTRLSIDEDILHFIFCARSISPRFCCTFNIFSLSRIFNRESTSFKTWMTFFTIFMTLNLSPNGWKKTHVYDSLDRQNWTIKNILTSVHLFQQIKPKQKLAFDTYETHV